MAGHLLAEAQLMMSSRAKTPHILRALVLLVACSGDQGPPGSPGANTVIATTDEPAGAYCPNGGTKVEAGVDDNKNGVLDSDEVINTTYVCDGAGTSALV